MRSDIFRRDASITKAILLVTNSGYCHLTVLSPKNTFSDKERLYQRRFENIISNNRDMQKRKRKEREISRIFFPPRRLYASWRAEIASASSLRLGDRILSKQTQRASRITERKNITSGHFTAPAKIAAVILNARHVTSIESGILLNFAWFICNAFRALAKSG